MILDGEQARDPTVPSSTYEYDLLVIGGGSGGLSCAKVIASSRLFTTPPSCFCCFRSCC